MILFFLEFRVNFIPDLISLFLIASFDIKILTTPCLFHGFVYKEMFNIIVLNTTNEFKTIYLTDN